VTRPYLKSSIEELEKLAELGARDSQLLRTIAHELSFRSTERARRLLVTLGGDLHAAGPTTRASAEDARKRTATAAKEAQSRSAHGGGSCGPLFDSPTTVAPARFKPTDEQQRIVDAFVSGASLKVNAFAGSGKTSTLQLLAAKRPKGGLYLAFNRALADEAAAKFPSSIPCKTTHALARGQVSHIYGGNGSKLTDPLNANRVVDVLGLEELVVGRDRTISARSLGAIALEIVLRFQRSAADRVGPEHVPNWGVIAMLDAPTRAELESTALRHAAVLWERMRSTRDMVPLGHDGYLKVWALSKPVLVANYVLLDEAQDTNAVVLDVLSRQSAQVIYVGDRYQQIYEWRGAVNAMESVDVARELHLTMSFRFGPAIAGAASKLLAALGEHRTIQGNPTVASRIGCANPDAILCRTNATVLAAVVAAAGQGNPVHIVGGGDELRRLVDGVADLQQARPTNVPEFFGFSTWREVVAFSETQEGASLSMLVGLVDRYGVKQLAWALGRLTPHEDSARLIVSTAHKAKGRQWKRVALAEDFAAISQEKSGKAQVDPAELRLLYVAMTRAQLEVELPHEVISHFKLDHGAATRSQPLHGISGGQTITESLPLHRSADFPVADRVAESAPTDGILGSIKRLFGG